MKTVKIKRIIGTIKAAIETNQNKKKELLCKLKFPGGVTIDVNFVKKTKETKNMYDISEWKFDFAYLLAFKYWNRIMTIENEAPEITQEEVNKELKELELTLQDILSYVINYANENNLL